MVAREFRTQKARFLGPSAPPPMDAFLKELPKPAAQHRPPSGLMPLFVPAQDAHKQLNLPLDPYLTRPHDIIRRGYDELALVLHYFVLATMLATASDNSPIIFFIDDELQRSEQDLVLGIPVLNRVGKAKLSGKTAADIRHFVSSIHAREAGFLLQHVKRLMKNPPGRAPMFYGNNARIYAKRLFSLRNFIVHRAYLAVETKQTLFMFALGLQIFKDMHALVNELRWKDDLIAHDIQTAIHDHIQSLSSLRTMFRWLCDHCCPDAGKLSESAARTESMPDMSQSVQQAVDSSHVFEAKVKQMVQACTKPAGTYNSFATSQLLQCRHPMLMMARDTSPSCILAPA